jgi:predicted lipid-binding transport protein (Tim44 family)
MNVKKRKMQHLFFIMVVIALALLIANGCTTKFTRETSTTKISEGEKAISIAKESNASIDAPADLAVARDKLTVAKTALEKEDYETATRLAAQASVDADYARVKAISEKAKRATEKSREDVNTLRDEVERMPK